MAGTSHTGAFGEVTEEDFDAAYRVHVKGPFFLTQTLLPLIADGGRIVNISSGLTRIIYPGRIAYGAMKGAVEVMTRYMAKELGPRRIAVNTVAPGAIQTDFSGGMVRDNPEVAPPHRRGDRARPPGSARRYRPDDRLAAVGGQSLGQRAADRGVGRAGDLAAEGRRRACSRPADASDGTGPGADGRPDRRSRPSVGRGALAPGRGPMSAMVNAAFTVLGVTLVYDFGLTIPRGRGTRYAPRPATWTIIAVL